MTPFKNVMEIFKLLEKTNCRKCNETTCLAFAGAVFKGNKSLSDCPFIDPDVLNAFPDQKRKNGATRSDLERAVKGLKQSIEGLDFDDSARRIGGIHHNEKLTLKVMGKDFSVDKRGRLYSDIHINPWITLPLLTYIVHCKGSPIKNNWLSLRELPNGTDRYPLFAQRCEKPLKRLADVYTELFEDLITIFNGKPIGQHFQWDIAIVLSPLPLIPMLICYDKPDEGMGSDLKVFFDSTANDNLGVEGIFSLGAGIVQMFEKIALRHGVVV